jgi:copper transport protein
VDRDRVEDDLQRPLAAHRAHRRAGLRHAVKCVEQVPVRAFVLVDRHGSGKASSGLRQRPSRVGRLATLVAFGSLAFPAVASAHATLLRTVPANGAVLAHAPRSIQVVFDDTIRIGSGNAVIDNASRASVLAAKAAAHGHTLTLPLPNKLRKGDYTARWSIVSDDGHREQGVIAFAVGAGRAPPQAALGASASLGWDDVLLRAVYFLGILVGGGAAAFGLLARSVLGDRIRRPLAQLLFFSFLATFLGGSGMIHASVSGTRFADVLRVAVIVALVGGVTAALAPLYDRLLYAAGACALALLAAPTLAGHALDRDQTVWISVPVDLAHLSSAAVWLGGLVSLIFVVPKASADPTERSRLARRFSTAALTAVCVLALSGLGRALTELHSVSQVWSTSYGRALIVKSVIFLPLLGLGWLNRTLLLDAFARLRRSAILESVLLLAIVVTVGVLTELRPGVSRPNAAAAAAPLQVAQPPKLPPRNAVVDAREFGTLAIAIARTPGNATVTLLGPDGTGVNGRAVRIDGRPATACGSGCYRSPAAGGPVRVAIGGRTVTFDVPARAPDGSALLRKVTRAFRALRTAVFDESLSSGPTNGIQTRFSVVAPNRLKYQTRGGPSAIVIGGRRWDRNGAGQPYVESPQTPLDVLQPYWTSVSNAHEIAPGVVTFLDPHLPAWFRMQVGGQLPRVIHMTAAAHFMTERYVGFDMPVDVSPPSR